MLHIEMLELDDPRWADFVRSRAEATPFHQPAWARLLADCYGFRAFAFALAEGDAIAAGVPFVEVKAFTEKRWVALPSRTRSRRSDRRTRSWPWQPV